MKSSCYFCQAEDPINMYFSDRGWYQFNCGSCKSANTYMKENDKPVYFRLDAANYNIQIQYKDFYEANKTAIKIFDHSLIVLDYAITFANDVDKKIKKILDLQVFQ